MVEKETMLQMIETGEAVAMLCGEDQPGKPAVVIGTPAIRQGFDPTCLQQAWNSRYAPGVTRLVLNPDAHAGYGAPIGSVLVSPSHIYPGPVGVDMKCSMSLLQLSLPEEALGERPLRRALIDAICERIPTGAGRDQRSVKKSRPVSAALGRTVAAEGASQGVCEALGIPPEWARRCEDAFHRGHDGTVLALEERLEWLISGKRFDNFADKIRQLGTYGSGNHFGEANVVTLASDEGLCQSARAFGLREGHIAFLSHCGSRGFGYHLAKGQFRTLQEHFERWDIAFPGGDRELVYAPLETPEADAYLDDMALAGNFATVNHLLINSLVLEAFQEVLPGTQGELVYTISHNIAREEELEGKKVWVHRKGATRAFPAGHPGLKGTAFEATGHPILLPGDPQSGSVVMVAEPGAELSCYSVNHGAGRALGRKAAMRTLDQAAVDASFDEKDILTNCRKYPLDEAPEAYKDFSEVVRSVELAGLARTVARLRAKFVIKDSDTSLRGAA